MDVRYLESASEFRTWLEGNHDGSQELWIGFYKTSASKRGITYSEAVDQALCFGWIDAVRKRIDDDRYVIRFTPRKSHSKWSKVNLERVAELKKLGRMTPAGLKAFEEREKDASNTYSYEDDQQLDPALEKQLRANARAWDFFQAQPPGYRKIVSHWVMSAKREETRSQRLSELIEGSEKGQRLDPYKSAEHRGKR
jgi:uncharacterized protein YdeI (YjbR/CyaY-like superfamily)